MTLRPDLDARLGTAISAWLVALFVTLSGLAAAAQVGDVAESIVPEDDQAEDRTFSVGLSGAKVDEDWYARLTLGFQWRIPELTIAREGRLFDEDQTHDLRLSFWAPLSLLLVDREPKGQSRFRDDEWDSAGEFMRILRRIEYGSPYAGVYLRAGELANVNIGHRTILSNYSNSADVDQFEWGMHGAFNTVYGGLELMLDDFTQPEVAGYRLYARPATFVNTASWWRRFAVGTSLVGDFRAPLVLATDETGRYVRTGQGGFDVENVDPTGVIGFDAELAVLRVERGQIVPYTDVNTHLGFGSGWHTGVFFGAKPADIVAIDGRLEYRMLGRNYIPAYFGPLYEVQRYAYRRPGDSPTLVPKLRWLQSGSENSLRHGYVTELGIDIGRAIRISGGWENSTGANNSLGYIQISVPAFRVFQFGAYYANANFDGAKGFFDLGSALAIVEARARIVKWLFVTGQLNRRWYLDSDGEYEPVDDFALGVSAVFGF